MCIVHNNPPNSVKLGTILGKVGFCTLVFSFLVLEFWLHAGHLGFDFGQRLNETECVLAGIDPHDVWTKKKSIPEYRPYNEPATAFPPDSKPVTGYSPWCYTYMMPFTALSRSTAGWTWYILEIIAASMLLAIPIRETLSCHPHAWLDALTMGCAAFLPGAALANTLFYEHFGLPMAFCALGMVWALNRGRDILAGFLWSFLMVKPNIGVLFAVPLLIGRKWKTIIVAATTCLSASVPASILVGKSPITLSLEMFVHGKAVLNDTGLLPGPVFGIVSRAFPSTAVSLASGAIGLLLCAVLSYKLAVAGTDWLARLAPAALLSTAWTYAMFADELVMCIACVWAARLVLFPTPRNSEPPSRRLRLVAMSFLLLCLLSFVPFFHCGWNPLLFAAKFPRFPRWIERIFYGAFRFSFLPKIAIFTLIVSVFSFQNRKRNGRME